MSILLSITGSRSLACVFWLVISFAAVVQAKVPQQIRWPDLIPKAATIKNPFSVLSVEHRYDLEQIVMVQNWTKAERTQPQFASDVENARKLEKKLTRQGIDVNRLVAEFNIYRQRLETRQRRVVSDLDGKQVRIAGYFLPLDFSTEGSTNFLLVPFLGACIHVPPPPPNQIVFVQLKQSFVVKDLYTPVWITGTLATKNSSSLLSFVDGAAKVSAGYHLSGEHVRRYKE